MSRLEDGDLCDALERLRALHGLATIRAGLSWFQEHHRLSAATAKAINRTHDHLLGKVAADSLGPVDAFAIPDQILAAPIAAYQQRGTNQ